MNKARTREELRAQLVCKGYRLTQSRETILALLRSTTSHPDANWIYDQVRKKLPHISLGTIYRTLNVLVEAGCIGELHFGNGQARYDGNVSEHYHVVCTECGALGDVFVTLPADLESAASEHTDYQITSHHLEFRGLCRECRQRKKESAGLGKNSNPVS